MFCLILFQNTLENKSFTLNNLLFYVVYSTGHIQLQDQKFEASENNLQTLGVFINPHKLLIEYITQYCLKTLNYYYDRKDNHESWMKKK